MERVHRVPQRGVEGNRKGGVVTHQGRPRQLPSLAAALRRHLEPFRTDRDDIRLASDIDFTLQVPVEFGNHRVTLSWIVVARRDVRTSGTDWL